MAENLNEVFKKYLQENPQTTDPVDQLAVYRIYDNYTMNDEDAQVAFDKVMSEVASDVKQPKLNLEEKTAVKPSTQVKLNDAMAG